MSEVVTRHVADRRVVKFDCAGVGVVMNSRNQRFEPTHGTIVMAWDSQFKKRRITVTVKGFIINKSGSVGIATVGCEWEDGDPTMPPDIQKTINEHRQE